MLKPNSKFSQNKHGAVAVLFAIALVPLIFGSILAVDYSGAAKNRALLQTLTDAAALAGANAVAKDNNDERQAVALAWFDAQASASGLTGIRRSARVTTLSNIEVLASASYKPTVTIPGISTVDVSTLSSAAITMPEAKGRVADLVFCIDSTMSMGTTLNMLKARWTTFADDFNNALKSRSITPHDHLRIRMLFFRDMAFDGGSSIYTSWGWLTGITSLQESLFFEHPLDQSKLNTVLDTIFASGGGDLQDSGHECLNAAMRSPWFTKGATIPGTTTPAQSISPIIVMITDTDPLPFGHFNSLSRWYYPLNMPRNAADFVTNWNNPAIINQVDRRLFMFGPCSNPAWSTVSGLKGFRCAGTINDANTDLVNKLANMITATTTPSSVAGVTRLVK